MLDVSLSQNEVSAEDSQPPHKQPVCDGFWSDDTTQALRIVAEDLLSPPIICVSVQKLDQEQSGPMKTRLNLHLLSQGR
ncbi:hypothetical protein EYF80_020614 [Liparis tanakae]|uniref:Uncharacterized protein n=1 Tax=Liparis tanakae TaxID=230148 RepID=A0A4Z2HTZ3_9TELE|nr:hypothetical protein EYF80_020614 [Liparis tanakae]